MPLTASEKLGGGIRTPLGAEKPKGEWNEIELHVHGSEKSTHILNGEVVLETFDFQSKDKSGTISPLAKGHIGLQAEWAELMYRNIRIKDLSAEHSASQDSEMKDVEPAVGSGMKEAEPAAGSGTK